MSRKPNVESAMTESTIAPPRSPQSVAGDYELLVSAVSENNEVRSEWQLVRLTVNPYYEFSTELWPDVYQAGQITLDQKPVSLDELTQRLAAARSQYKGLGVLVRGDGTGQFQRVAHVLSACKKAGIADLGIAVRVAENENGNGTRR